MRPLFLIPNTPIASPFWHRRIPLNAPITFGNRKRPEELCYQDFQAQLNQQGWDIKTLLQESVQEKNKLGIGGEAVAFSIPGIEDYVVRINYYGSAKDFSDLDKIKQGQFPTEPLVAAVDEFSDLNIGQAIAQINNIKILKRQREYSLDLDQYKNNTPQYIKHYTDLISNIAALPQEAFEKLIELHLRVREKGYFVDCDRRNTFLDTEAKALNIIDVFKAEQGPLTTFIGLLDHFQVFALQAVSTQPELINFRKTIFLKLLKAALKHNIPLGKPTYDSADSHKMFWNRFHNVLKSCGLLKNRSQIINYFKQQAS